MTGPLVLDGETIGYGGTAVFANVTFRLAAGERVVLLGRSGAGKSTLLGALYAQLLRQQRAPALVPQDHALVPQLSVYHNVFMGRLDRHGAIYNLANLVRPWPRASAEIHDILEAVGLADELRRPVEALSGGQKQRAALARAFYRGGDVLIGDEPVTAVDEMQAARLLREVEHRFATTVLALHDVDLAMAHASRIVGISDGRIVFDAPPASVDRRRIADLYGKRAG